MPFPSEYDAFSIEQWSALNSNIIPLELSQCLSPDCLASNPSHCEVCQRCGVALRLAGRYRAIQSIGSGGFAATFKAIDEHRLGTPCVIKLFLPQQKDSQMYQKAVDLFTQEAVLLKDLGNHPQIPELKAFFEQEGRLYIVQEFIEGQNLRQEFEQRGCFTEAEIEGMLNSLLPVLQFVHDHRVIHRDIKPSNIIRKNDGTLVLIDFGSSHQSYVRLFNRQTPNTATPGYAPPEQLQGQVFPTSDLFSLGLTALRLLTGSFPDDAGVDPLYDLQQKQWVWGNHLENINARLAKVLGRLLQPQVALRYASAQAVLEDLATSALVCQVPLPTDGLLDSTVGASPYARLQTLLATHRYQEADTETWQLLLQLSNRTEQETLNLDAIEALPCAALETIDRLWWTYSQGRFGLRVQQQLYQSLGGTTEFNFQVWQAFAAQVGWFRHQRWAQASDLIYADTAPMGHLPACCMDALTRRGTEQGVCNWWRLGFVTLMERLETCHFARY